MQVVHAQVSGGGFCLLLSESLLVCTATKYSETSLIQHSMGPENNVGLGGCWIMECLLPYLSMVTVPHIRNGQIRETVGL